MYIDTAEKISPGSPALCARIFGADWKLHLQLRSPRTSSGNGVRDTDPCPGPGEPSHTVPVNHGRQGVRVTAENQGKVNAIILLLLLPTLDLIHTEQD